MGGGRSILETGSVAGMWLEWIGLGGPRSWVARTSSISISRSDDAQYPRVVKHSLRGIEVPMAATDQLRELLARQLDWEDAHVGYRRAVADFPQELRGVVPAGFAHSGWQLVEHLRRAQTDILDFCLDPDYVEPASLDEYWPGTLPEDDTAWDGSVRRFEEDLQSLKRLALDEAVDLGVLVPTGAGRQTYLRELLLVVDHNAYHVGQLVTLRRVLGAWHD
jgi:uncharacterized damage-inducible protein DinB